MTSLARPLVLDGMDVRQTHAPCVPRLYDDLGGGVQQGDPLGLLFFNLALQPTP